MVCAHDSEVADIRVTSARPKIIKLHGDFLYDSIRNTVRETETLEKNMRDKFLQFVTEYGLVVVGYGGNDRSIMDVLDTMLRSQGYLPNGLYWCVRNQDRASRKLQRLMRPDNAYWVEIEGFDEFMAELHEGLGLTLPDAVRDPYKATTERLNTFILPMEEVKHPIIKDDIAELEEQVKTFERVISGEAPKEEFDRLVPYRFLGAREYERHDYEGALLYYEKALVQNPSDLDLMGRMVWSHIWTEDFQRALELSEKMISQAPTDFRGHWRKGSSLVRLNRLEDAIASCSEALKYTADKTPERGSVLLSRSNTLLIAENWEEALSDAQNALLMDPENQAALLNKCMALKKLGREDESKQIVQDVLPKIKHKYGRACAFAQLGDRENMLKELESAIKRDSGYAVDAKFDPDFTDYREDPDFRKVVYG
jgi:tetratricopeptide (TPR) repeat protein